MAVVVAVPEKTQTKTAMSKVMQYVAQEKKTLSKNADGQKYKLLSGQNCCGDTAFQEFMATKRQYGKEKGVYFYQYVQSFKPDVKITPQGIHKMGIELAQYFEGFEVQIATHIDRDHWHNHLIVNSVSCENGKKLQFNEKDLIKLRALSDKICRAHGLEILKPYEKSKQKPISAREYRAAARGNSWKFKLMAAIDGAMAQSRSKAEFIAYLERLGYKVKWEPHHKYITYTTPDGKLCRDNKLHETKYLKTEMEGYFHAELRQTQGIERHAGGTPKTIPVGEHGCSQGALGLSGTLSDRGRQGTDGSLSEDRKPAHLGERGRGNQQTPGQNVRSDTGFGRYNSQPSNHGASNTDEEFTDGYDGSDEQNSGANETNAPSQRPVPHQTETQMGGNGGVDSNDILYLAKTLEAMVNPYDPEEEKQKKKYLPKAEKKKRNKKIHDLSNDYDMSL